jgi:hypothetical protein
VAVIRAFLADDGLQSNVTTDLATKHYPEFARAIDGDTFDRLNQIPGLLTAMLAEAQGRGLDEDTQALLNQLLTLQDLQPVRDFVDLGVAELRKLDKQDWTAQLATTGALLRLAHRLRVRKVEVGLGVNFQDPLLQLVKETRLGRKSLPTLTKGGPGLDQPLSSKQQTVFWDSVLAGLLQSDVVEQSFERLIEGIGVDMIRAVPFETRGNDVFLRLLRGPVDRKNAKELAWVRDLLQARPQLLSSHGAPTAALFDLRARAQVLASDKGANEDVKRVAAEIVALMGQSGALEGTSGG